MTESQAESGTSTDDLVLAERRDGVLLLTLNRPDRLNAWTDPLEERYFALLDEADADPGIGAVVVTGAGRGFCAGADLDLLASASDAPRGPSVERATPRSRPLTLRKPLIAAINGPAVGLGLVEALFCDIRFCVPEAKLGTAFARRGLIAEYGISWLLPRIVGSGRAADLLLSGRTVSGEDALRYGLVDFLVEPGKLVDEAVAYAQDLARNCSPISMAVIKEQLRDDWEHTFAEASEVANQRFVESFERADIVEGIASHREKRAPQFLPLPPQS